MQIELRQVLKEEREILKNLLEKYDYEFSQWDGRELNQLGLYGYDYLDYYWTEPNRWAYFILVDQKLAGFVMVNEHSEVASEKTDYVIAEFFVMYKYRRSGVGRVVATQIFEKFKGKWQLKRHPHNISSVAFWNRVIADYTEGNYKLVEGHPEVEFGDGTLGDVFFFDNSNR